jgi:alpha-amylase
VTDHDLDGRDEVLLESDCTNVYVAPARGGTIFELDARIADWNLLATMSRHEEAYHDGLAGDCDTLIEDKVRNIHDGLVVKERGLEKLVGVDAPPAVSAIDRFYAPGVGRSDAEAGHGEVGDLAWAECEFELSRKDGAVGVWLGRTGAVSGEVGRCPVTLEKSIWLMPRGNVRVEYDVRPAGELDAVFATEWNLSFLTPDKEWVTLSADGGDGAGLRKRRSLDSVEALSIEDRLRGRRVDVRFEGPAGVWSWPLDTASHSEGGLEKVFQGVTLVARWPVRAGSGERLSFALELGCSPLDGA